MSHTVNASTHPSATWETAELDLDAYLRRVGYTATPRPDWETLWELQGRHLRAISFENIEVQLGQQPKLDIVSLQDKLVHQQRGGYCYEQNILFATVLARIGFDVTGLHARILAGDEAESMTPTTHATLLVRIAGESWLVDVGVGSFAPSEPIRIADGEVTHTDGTRYHLGIGSDGLWLLRYRRAYDWFNVYKFSMEPAYRSDYAHSNFVVANNPNSHFVRRLVVQRVDADVRHDLVGDKYAEHRPGAEPVTRTIAPEELPVLLDDVFGLRLSTEDLAVLRTKAA